MKKRPIRKAAHRPAPVARSATGDGPRGVWLTRLVLALAAAIVLARLLMNEALRSPDQIAPGGRSVTYGPGPATGVLLDWLGLLCPLLVLLRRRMDKTFRPPISLAAGLMIALGGWTLSTSIWAPDRFAAGVMAFHWLSAAAVCWAVSQCMAGWQDVRLSAALCAGLLAALAARGIEYSLLDRPANIAEFDRQRQAAASASRPTATPLAATQPSTRPIDRLIAADAATKDTFNDAQLALRIRSEEVLGFSLSPNTYAALLVMLGCVALGIAADAAERRRWLAFAMLAIVLAGAAWVLPKTQSRTGLLTAGLGFSLLIGFGLLGRRSAAWSGRLYVLGTLAVLGLIAFVVGYGIARGTLFHDSLNFRWRYWVGAYHVWLNHPIGGVGWENFAPAYLGVRELLATEEIRDPHNYLLRFLAETGLIGAALALAWSARTWWEITRPTAAGPLQPTSSRTGVVGPLQAATLGITLCIAATTDLQSSAENAAAYAIYEAFRRGVALFIIAVVGGVACCALRSREEGEPRVLMIDETPAKWPLLGMVVGVGMLFVHSMVDFAMFEPGPMFLLAWMIGVVLGTRGLGRQVAPAAAEPAAARPIWRVRLERTAGRLALPLAAAGWVVSALALVLPVTSGEALARDADEALLAGRSHAAAAGLESAFRGTPRNPNYAERSATAWAYAGEATRASSMADAAVQAHPGDASLRRWRAELLLRLPEPDIRAAADDYAAAVQLDPKELPPRVRLGQLLEVLGKPAEALQAYAAALDLDAQFPEAEKDRLPPAMAAEARAAVQRLRQPTP
jgi:hypothetical protein